MQFPERFSSQAEYAFPRLRRRDTPAGYPRAASIRAALLAGIDDAAAGLQAIRATLAAPRTAERV